MSESHGTHIGAGLIFAGLLYYAAQHGFPWWVEGGLFLTFVTALVELKFSIPRRLS